VDTTARIEEVFGPDSPTTHRAWFVQAFVHLHDCLNERVTPEPVDSPEGRVAAESGREAQVLIRAAVTGLADLHGLPADSCSDVSLAAQRCFAHLIHGESDSAREVVAAIKAKRDSGLRLDWLIAALDTAIARVSPNTFPDLDVTVEQACREIADLAQRADTDPELRLGGVGLLLLAGDVPRARDWAARHQPALLIARLVANGLINPTSRDIDAIEDAWRAAGLDVQTRGCFPVWRRLVRPRQAAGTQVPAWLA
jgi:hypothetical protein